MACTPFGRLNQNAHLGTWVGCIRVPGWANFLHPLNKFYKPQTKPKTERPHLAWYWLQVQAVEAHIFGADAALAFAYIRYTRKMDRNYEPSVRLLAANVPGLSNHRARFVMECLHRRIYFAENELRKANKRFAEIIKDLAAEGKNYKRLKLRGGPINKGIGRYEYLQLMIKHVMQYP